MSDFSLTMDNDVIRCITHFRGLKCDMNIDNCASTVTVSGIGHNIWRDDFFPVVARLLFTQYVKFAESQVIESYTNGDADDRSKAGVCTNDPIRENHVPETMQQPLSQDQLTASKIAYELPVYTSTPIVNRMETQHDRINTPVVSEIIKKIDQMETELRMVKQSVISNMEKQIRDLRSSVLEMIGKIKPDMTYAAAVQSSSKPTEKSQILQMDTTNGSRNTAVSDNKASDNQPSCGEDLAGNQSTDEGFCNYSNSILESSQTFVKTVCPAVRNVKATEAVGQPVPVLITNRNTETGNDQQRDLETTYQRQQPNTSNAVNRTDTNAKGKLLLIGDSILNSINTKGLVKGVLKHSKGGAKIQDLIEDISVYDMRNFETCIIYIGGNDCAKQTNLNSFVDAYDQLISLIKTTNPACKIYLCKIAPRGDVDVSGFNKGIERLSKDWERRKVHCISNTNAYFLTGTFTQQTATSTAMESTCLVLGQNAYWMP